MTDDRKRAIGRAAFVAAVAGTVLGPVHALSRYATEEGKEDLELPGVRLWAEPAGDALSPLLDWAGPDTVYTTYGKAWALVFLAATACAFVVRRERDPRGAETWGWRLALPGYVVVTVGVLGTYWTPLLEEFFLATMPGMLLSLIGSTVLGIALLRRGFRPRSTAVVLATWIPAMVLLSTVIALGAAALPMVWAWALAGRRLAAPERPVQQPVVTPA